jgi:hypothetical protein
MFAVLSQNRNVRDQSWALAFEDSGTEDWTQNWFKDGERSTVNNTKQGMVFSAGPVFGDNGSHSVLWTKQSFYGDLKIEFDYTRLDDIDRAVNILYIQATGTGEGPYHADIAKWSSLREVPYMRTYFLNMNLLHISFAAFPTGEGEHSDYVRARVYPVPEGGNFSRDTRLLPDNFDTDLFKPGITYHFTVTKIGHRLSFKVEQPGTQNAKEFRWDTSSFHEISSGRIGIRHMYTRAARYANIKVYRKAD